MNSGKRLMTMNNVDECVQKLVDVLSRNIRLSIETIYVQTALGRILADDIVATFDKPCKDSSAVDGYAVCSDDTIGASYYNPVELAISGHIKPGEIIGDHLIRGTAIRVHTGSFIPPGADAVVMDEDVVLRGDKILLSRSIPPGSNILRKGEDFKKGETLIPRGSVLTPFAIASIVANGIPIVSVYRKIRVSIISIGNEIVEPGHDNKDCLKTYNSSAYLLSTLMMQDKIFEVTYHGVFPDNVDTVFNVIEKIRENIDIVITTGGTGVSESDVVYDLVERYGRWIFRGVRMRPGRPTSCSLIGGTPVIHVSGFPVAAWAGYEAIIRPAIIKWLGAVGMERVIIYSKLEKKVPNNVGYRSLVRVSLEKRDDGYIAKPYMLRGSGLLSSLLKTNGYIVIPEDVEGYEKNSIVPVYLY